MCSNEDIEQLQTLQQQLEVAANIEVFVHWLYRAVPDHDDVKAWLVACTALQMYSTLLNQQLDFLLPSFLFATTATAPPSLQCALGHAGPSARDI